MFVCMIDFGIVIIVVVCSLTVLESYSKNEITRPVASITAIHFCLINHFFITYPLCFFHSYVFDTLAPQLMGCMHHYLIDLDRSHWML